MIDMSLNTIQEKVGMPLLANRFYADFPALGDNMEGDMTYFMQSASTPTKTIGEILINHMGLQYKIPGDVTYGAFTVTFICDENNTSYNYMQLWSQLVVDDISNSRGKLSDVKKTIDLHQTDVNGQIKSTWYIEGLFPTEVGEISLDKESADTISIFTVTFAMDLSKFKSI